MVEGIIIYHTYDIIIFLPISEKGEGVMRKEGETSHGQWNNYLLYPSLWETSDHAFNIVYYILITLMPYSRGA